MLVYRVEGHNGYGPYTFPGFLCGLPEDLSKHPLPKDDGIDPNKIVEFHVFGFDSLDSLQAWFSVDDRRYLLDKGFVIKVYECPILRVIQGKRQLVFDRDYAIPQKTLDILDFFTK